MPRKPRIEILGYYHVINRGVEKRVIFKDRDDYEQFEELMCFYAKNYGITIDSIFDAVDELSTIEGLKECTWL